MINKYNESDLRGASITTLTRLLREASDERFKITIMSDDPKFAEEIEALDAYQDVIRDILRDKGMVFG